MRSGPSLAAYQAVQRLAGDRWPALREELLAGLRGQTSLVPQAPVDIFLEEGLVDDAIGALEASPAAFSNYVLVERVADAATPTRPDWVIRTCQAQAERIMDAGKAPHYHHAVGWLSRVKTAYLAAGQAAEWRTYLSEVLARHKRKYSLVPLLERLRAEA